MTLRQGFHEGERRSMPKSGLLLGLALAIAGLAFVFVLTFRSHLPALIAPELGRASAQGNEQKALDVRAQPAGVFTQFDTPYLPAEREWARPERSKVVAWKNPDVIDPTTQALRKERYQQFLADHGWVPVDQVQLRTRTTRDSTGRVISEEQTLLVPERPTRPKP
jgi:hypothetical protein